MTTSEWNKFLIWSKTNKKSIQGHIMLYPDSIKFITEPSYYDKERYENRMDLFFSPDENGFRIINDTTIKAKSQKYSNTVVSRLNIHYKHIKTMRIYNYNN